MDKTHPPALNRRTVFAAAGFAGTLAAVATVLPTGEKTMAVAGAEAAKPVPAGGYQLSDHVKQYYATARV